LASYFFSLISLDRFALLHLTAHPLSCATTCSPSSSRSGLFSYFLSLADRSVGLPPFSYRFTSFLLAFPRHSFACSVAIGIARSSSYPSSIIALAISIAFFFVAWGRFFIDDG